MQGRYDALMTPRLRRLGIKQFTNTMHITHDESRGMHRSECFCKALHKEVVEGEHENAAALRTIVQTQRVLDESRAVLSRTLKQRQEVLSRCSADPFVRTSSARLMTLRPGSTLVLSRTGSSRPVSGVGALQTQTKGKISRWELKQRIAAYKAAISEFRRTKKLYADKRKRIEKLKADQNYQEKIRGIMDRLQSARRSIK